MLDRVAGFARAKGKEGVANALVDFLVLLSFLRFFALGLFCCCYCWTSSTFVVNTALEKCNREYSKYVTFFTIDCLIP